MCGITRSAAANATTPTGTLTRKIQDQCRLCRIAPPITGPRIGASIAGIETIAITLPMRCGPATCAMISWPTGMIMPPPTPCSTRKATSASVEPATAHNAEPAVNSTSEVM